jgi:8-oxo-dGTP pyrophosphatase MutT (NUDIX family)
VKVVGVTPDGSVAFSAPLGHGQDPEVLAFDEGYSIERPLDATRGSDLGIVLRVLVQPLSGEARPEPRLRGLDKGLVLDEIDPVVRQRVAAYAVVVSERGLLATEYSDRTAVAERWGMPGGGIDDHEEPAGAVLREVAEETSQLIDLGELIKIQTSHWIGRSPRAEVEDFHAIRLIYRGSCAAPTDAVVVDHGGTTESARWVPLPEWRQLPWTINWQQILGELLSAGE